MRRLGLVLISALVCSMGLTTPALACVGLDCDESPQVDTGEGSLTASLVEQNVGGSWVASNAVPVEHPFTYQLSHPCVVDDRENGACRASDFFQCPVVPGRVIE